LHHKSMIIESLRKSMQEVQDLIILSLKTSYLTIIGKIWIIINKVTYTQIGLLIIKGAVVLLKISKIQTKYLLMIKITLKNKNCLKMRMKDLIRENNKLGLKNHLKEYRNIIKNVLTGTRKSNRMKF